MAITKKQSEKAVKTVLASRDMVNHPYHYTSSDAVCDKCGDCIECIEVTRHMSFNIGNAVKYLWRFQDKGGLEDLKKARWYLEDHMKEMERKCKTT
jgi:hypothetical protein